MVYREAVVSRVLQERPARMDFARLCSLVRQAGTLAPAKVPAGFMRPDNDDECSVDGDRLADVVDSASQWIHEYLTPAHGLKIDAWAVLPLLLQRAANSSFLNSGALALGVDEEFFMLSQHTNAALQWDDALLPLWVEVVFSGPTRPAKRARAKLRSLGVRGKHLGAIRRAVDAWYAVRIERCTQLDYGMQLDPVLGVDERQIRRWIVSVDVALGVERRMGRPPKD